MDMLEQLKGLLGENYQEGMSAQDVQNAFNKMLLSSGKYVNKDNADAQQRKIEKDFQTKMQALEEKNKALNDSLSSKMTDEEKIKAEQAEKEKEFEKMKEMLAESKMNTSKLNFTNNISEAKRLAEISDEDETFSTFISNAVLEDSEKNNSVSKYINTMVKKAYEKGKADATKDSLGKMGKDGRDSSSNGNGDNSNVSAAEQEVKKLLQTQAKANESYYFKK